MSVTSKRVIGIAFSGDVDAPSLDYGAADNSSSPGVVALVDLVTGANTITPPTGTKAVTIIPPSGNLILITLKGVTGDTGVPLHLTDPSSIALNAADDFCLTAADDIVGVRLIWS
jgi:hypothetical protein